MESLTEAGKNGCLLRLSENDGSVCPEVQGEKGIGGQLLKGKK